MKKRLPYILISAIYILSLGLGFGFAGLRQVNAKSFQEADPRQANWIVVRVDDMQVEQPQLVSIWGLFLTFSPGPQLYFKPFYSFDVISDPKSEFARLFSVTPDRELSISFLKSLDRLNIHRSGLVILDNEGFQKFSEWFSQPPDAAQIFIPVVETAASGALEFKAYQKICTSLKSTNAVRSRELPLQSLSPLHLLSHPSLESFMNLWGRVVDSNITPHCDVFPLP